MKRPNPKTSLYDFVFLGVAILLGLWLFLGATWSTGESADSIVSLTPYQAIGMDTLIFRSTWSESVPLRGTSPVEGYTWQATWAGQEQDLFTNDVFMVEGATQGPDDREAFFNGPATCGDTIYYQIRVRPTGQWDNFAGWGYSPIVEFYCDNTAPLPPEIIDLDTIPEFPMDEWPVDVINSREGHIKLSVLPIRIDSSIQWNILSEVGSTELIFSAEFETAELCTFAERDGQLYKAFSEYSTISVSDSTQLSIVESGGEFDCIHVTSMTVNENTFVEH